MHAHFVNCSCTNSSKENAFISYQTDFSKAVQTEIRTRGCCCEEARMQPLRYLDTLLGYATLPLEVKLNYSTNETLTFNLLTKLTN